MPQDILGSFANHVRTLRHERKLTQEQVADKSGLHLTYIAGIESGKRNPTLLSIVALAAGLEASPVDLLVGIRAASK